MEIKCVEKVIVLFIFLDNVSCEEFACKNDCSKV